MQRSQVRSPETMRRTPFLRQSAWAVKVPAALQFKAADFGNTALQALLNLVAIALENARSREMVTRSQAARQSQEFKSTLLDGLAHEFKTPLTTIRAATTALLGSNLSRRRPA